MPSRNILLSHKLRRGCKMKISAFVWRDSFSRVSAMHSYSSVGYDFLLLTCLVNCLASHKKLKGKGGVGFSLCPRLPGAGSVPQTSSGAAHPQAPSPGTSRGRLASSPTPLATAKTIVLPREAWAGQGPGCGRPPDLTSGTPVARLLPPLTGTSTRHRKLGSHPQGYVLLNLSPLEVVWPR